ncbi:MAG: MnhB domain-containing protein, partial [Rhodospirillales bacterium]
MRGHLILRVVSKILIPFLLMFALYVQFHGDFGPGGGFQAGVIVAAAFVLYALIFGLRAMQKIISPALLEIAVPLGVLIYA